MLGAGRRDTTGMSHTICCSSRHTFLVSRSTALFYAIYLFLGSRLVACGSRYVSSRKIWRRLQFVSELLLAYMSNALVLPFYLSNPNRSLSQGHSVSVVLDSDDGRCSRKLGIWTVRRCIVGRSVRRFAFLATAPCSVVRNIRVRENFTSDRTILCLR